MQSQHTKLAALLSVSLVSSFVVVVLLAGPALAGPTYQVTETGIGVQLRNSPSMSDVKGSGGPKDGNSFELVCQAWGEAVGPNGNRVWDRIRWNGQEGFIPDTWTTTPTAANQFVSGVPECGSNLQGSSPNLQGSSPCLQGGCPAPPAAPATAAPVNSTIEGAIAWASRPDHLGTTTYVGLCLQFVYDAYMQAGKDIGRADSAFAWWNNHASTQHRGDTAAPRGALVFWGPTSTNPYGHVALALGDGAAISTYERLDRTIHRMSIAERNTTHPYLGWVLP